MVRRDRCLLLFLGLISVGFPLAVPVLGVNPDVLLALPPLLMLVPLAVGRYVGERTIARLRRPVPDRQRPARLLIVRVPRADRVLPRGGRLVAAAMARRGPPAPILAR
jgi:hypothetical protein